MSDAYDVIEKLFDQLGDFAVRVVQYSKGSSLDLKTKLVQILECLLEIFAHSEMTIKGGRANKFFKLLLQGKDETTNSLLQRLVSLQEGEQRQINAENYAVQQEQHHRTILDWLCPVNFPGQLSGFLDSKVEGTGSRFLDAAEFKDWMQGSNRTLYCSGMPGAGKTMMAATVIDHLSRQNEAYGVACIFCNYKTPPSEQNATILLASILRQLVPDQSPIGESVRRLYEHHSKKNTRPLLGEIFTTLKSAVKNYSRVYLVVDALDECPTKDGTRSKLLVKIRDLQKEKGTDLRLMVTSRVILEIEKFKEALRLEVRASDEDVKKFIADQMDRLPNVVQRDEELKDMVQSGIAQAVDGM